MKKPSIFMCTMNNIFIKYLDKFALSFIYGVVIYWKEEKECEEHLRLVLQNFSEHQFYETFS